jgi:hypothetical protein
MAKKELTLKQQAFIDEYLIDFKVKERDLYNDGERAETITTNRYRFWDKGRSLEHLGRCLAMYQEPGDKVGLGLGKLAGVLKASLEMKQKLLKGGNAD